MKEGGAGGPHRLRVTPIASRATSPRGAKRSANTVARRFELAALTGLEVRNVAEAAAAAAALSARMRPTGPRLVLASSLPGCADEIPVLVAGPEGAWCVRTPRLPIAVNGAGDLLAGLFLFYLLRRRTAPAALEASVAALHAVLRRTHALGQRELALVAAQDALGAPKVVFAVEPV